MQKLHHIYYGSLRDEENVEFCVLLVFDSVQLIISS